MGQSGPGGGPIWTFFPRFFPPAKYTSPQSVPLKLSANFGLPLPVATKGQNLALPPGFFCQGTDGFHICSLGHFVHFVSNVVKVGFAEVHSGERMRKKVLRKGFTGPRKDIFLSLKGEYEEPDVHTYARLDTCTLLFLSHFGSGLG